MMLEVAYVGTRGLQLSRGGESGFTLNQLPLEPDVAGQQTARHGGQPVLRGGRPGLFREQDGGARTSCCGRIRSSQTSSRCSPADRLPLITRSRPRSRSGISLGLQFEGSYTWSKSIDNGEGGFQDSNRIALNRAITDLDVPHRFILNYRLRAAVRPRPAFGLEHRSRGRVSGRLDDRRHHQLPERNGVRRFGEQRVPLLQPGVVREFEGLQREARRTRGGPPGEVVRHRRFQPAGPVHDRQHGSAVGRPAGR